ncbi:MAG: hypothetical protein ACE5JL_02125 [Dehalococcoidia bacterium]
MDKHIFNLKVLRGWMAEGMTPDRETIAALDHSMALITCVERRRICEASGELGLDSDCPYLKTPLCVIEEVDRLIEAQKNSSPQT